MPPSILRVWPVLKLADLPVRKSMAPVMSSGLPRRPRAVRRAIRASCSSGSVLERSVSRKPGAIAFTRIPRGPSSRARLRAKPSSAALVAA